MDRPGNDRKPFPVRSHLHRRRQQRQLVERDTQPLGDQCHQFVGDDKFLLGNIWTGVTNTAVRDEFAACNVYARKECRDCWARLYCSGGCAANSYNFHGSINDAYDIGCELQRKRVECAIMIKAATAEQGE